MGIYSSRLIADFILADRRLADWTGLFIRVSSDDGDEILLGECPVGRTKDYALGMDREVLKTLWVHSSEHMTTGSLQLLSVLAMFLQHSARPTSKLAFAIAQALRECRESVRIPQTQIAHQLGIEDETFSRWEGGALLTTDQALYKWGQSLGLFCSPKTALVRVVDFSPELLRFLQEDPTRLRSLTPDQFERFVADRLERMGYNVKLTGPTNRKDGGIDLIAVPKLANLGSVVIAGQVKHHRHRKTEREAVDRLLSWKDSYFGVGLLVTNTSFTRDAVWTAGQERNRHFLRLRDFTDLKRWLEGRFGEDKDWREIPDRVELAPGVVVEIPRPRITTSFDLPKNK